VDIINQSFDQSVFPTSTHIPIQKVPKTMKSDKFHPINMLSVYEKAMEIVIKDQLLSAFIDENNPPLNTNNRRRNTALMMTQNGNSSSNRNFLSLGSNLKICPINIEGISISKSEYLARLMHDKDIDIVTVQETHAGSEENLRRRGTCIYID
jgi:hypothetical protein